jgi:hypothetical protein
MKYYQGDQIKEGGMGWICSTPGDNKFQLWNVKERNRLGNSRVDGRVLTRNFQKYV